MTRPRTKAIPGYQIQPMLPMGFYLDGVVDEADFTKYDGVDCVEATVRLGMVKNPYTFVFTIRQALEADIVERVQPREGDRDERDHRDHQQH